MIYILINRLIKSRYYISYINKESKTIIKVIKLILLKKVFRLYNLLYNIIFNKEL